MVLANIWEEKSKINGDRLHMFIEKYTELKKKYTIAEGTVKQLIPELQRLLLSVDYPDGTTYADLTDEQKQQLQKDINDNVLKTEQRVNQITQNKQYQSWIYDILVRQDKNIYEDFEVIRDCINHFETLCKGPNLTPKQRNIQNYKTFQDLQKFILQQQDLQKANKGSNIWNCFEQIFKNSKYTLFKIKSDQYDQLNLLCGGKDEKYFNTGWCVAKNRNYFEDYLDGLKDYYVLWVYTINNKPFALLHYNSNQFKDTSDEPITDTKDQYILEGLHHCIPLFNQFIRDAEDDFEPFKTPMWLYNNPDKQIEHLIADRFDGVYDPTTKTIDFKGNQFYMYDEWLNENGSFDFNVINTSDDWCFMFADCKKLRQLPNNFTIPDGVTNCANMFEGCDALTSLPDNFTIPDTVTSCKHMFYNNTSLTHLPKKFKLSKNAVTCWGMFDGCCSLIKLPETFKLPDGLENCRCLFQNCHSLTKLPNTFTIPNSVKYCSGMFYNCYRLEQLPVNFKIPQNSSGEDRKYMFYNSPSIKNVLKHIK